MESQPQPKAVWRASLVNPHTRQQHGFASLDDLVDFLRRQIGQGASPDGDLVKTDTKNDT
jgi:hypothetical protein